MNVTEQLKPCPFCGGEAHFERIGTPRQSCIVECDSCGARLESSEEGVRCGRMWNTRAQPAQASQEAVAWCDHCGEGVTVGGFCRAKGTPALIEAIRFQCRNVIDTPDLSSDNVWQRKVAFGRRHMAEGILRLIDHTASPQPARAPLTVEQLEEMAVTDEFLLYCDQEEFNEIARAIEAAHGITGTEGGE